MDRTMDLASSETYYDPWWWHRATTSWAAWLGSGCWLLAVQTKSSLTDCRPRKVVLRTTMRQKTSHVFARRPTTSRLCIVFQCFPFHVEYSPPYTTSDYDSITVKIEASKNCEKKHAYIIEMNLTKNAFRKPRKERFRG